MNCGTTGARTVLQPSCNYHNVLFIGLADGEGDGDVDLLVMEREEYEDEALHTHGGTSQATLWFNDGDAEFVRSDRFTLDSEEGRSGLGFGPPSNRWEREGPCAYSGPDRAISSFKRLGRRGFG